MKCILLTIALSGLASVASAQYSGVDLGSTPPTPGQFDVSQLLTTGDTAQLNDGAINYFYDNTGAPYVGTSFTTGANPGGYKLTSLAFKFGGGPPVGYAGGNDTSLAGGWIISIYKLSGTGNTTATAIYTNTAGAIAGTANTGADWIQITNGFTSVTLLPNTAYAWTIYQPSGYDDLAYATGTPYKAGGICRIPPAGGAVTYATDADSATFNVGLSPIELPLSVTDLGANVNPTPGANDISQLLFTGSADPTAGINYYDNSSGSSTPGASGQSFTTETNPGGYVMTSLAVKFLGTSYGGADASGSQSWRIVIFQLSGTGNTTATPIMTNTSAVITTSSGGAGTTSADWLGFSGMYVPMLPNTVYAYTIDTSSSPSYSGYNDLGVDNVTPYTNGLICRIEDGGGTVTYYPTDPNTASFDIGLALQGFPSVGIGSATPNPCYALSPVSLSDTASGPGTLTYQWQTNNDLSGGLYGTWANIPNATNLTLTFTPPNADSGILDFQFIAHNSAGSVTSAPIALTVNSAQAPASSTGVVPANITTYQGATVSFSDTSFVGTTPITYQWQVNTGSGYTNIPSSQNPSATNTTLNLTNVQAPGEGSYQLVAFNSQGSANDSSVGIGTLALVTPPPLPTSTTPQNLPYLQYSNAPYAYWRLQETNNPATSPSAVMAYDYSGNSFFGTYGVFVTTSNAGPQPPSFPGFSSTELAAGTSGTGFLTVPPLNLGFTTNVTFTAWINPANNQANSTALLFNRNGNDASGFGFNANDNASGMPCLGFTWNSNGAATWGWDSGLYPLINLWSFVAYVITPTNETTYLAYVNANVTPNTTNFLVASINLANVAEAFSTTSDLGSDPQSTGRTFSGLLAEVALYTNSLSEGTVLNLFLTGIGGHALAPTPPVTLPSPNLFAGESYQLNGTAGGSPPITYQWMSSSDGLTWVNVPTNANYSGETSAILSINNATVANALQYEVVASNSVTSATSGVSTVSVTPVPTGLWTVNFQLTNATDEYGFVGLGSYTGRGVLGTGTYWNPIDDPNNAFTSGATAYTNVTDLEDNGVTYTGISVTVNGGGFTSQTAQTPAGSIATLLDQYIQVYGTGNPLQIYGLPDGTYNLAIYACDGSFGNDAANISVENAAGVTLSGSDINEQAAYFSPGDNTVLFTGVEATNGTLTVTFQAGSNPNNGGGVNADFCGLQIQLVRYAASVTNLSLAYAPTTVVTTSSGGVSVTNNALTLSWVEGILQTAANVTGPWVTMPDPSPITVSTTNTSRFYRLMIPAQ